MNGTTVVPALLMSAPAHRTQKPRPRRTGRFDLAGPVATGGRCVPITAERAGCQGARSAQIAIASRIAMTTTATLPAIETTRWILGVNRRPA